jgi:hypothetical protein
MKRFNINLLTGLVLSIVLLGIVSAVALLITTRIYTDLTFDFEREYLNRLVAIKTSDLLAQLEHNTFQLGLRIQASEDFRAALAVNNPSVLSAQLKEQFKQGLVTANVVPAVGIYAFDLDFRLLGSALRHGPGPGPCSPGSTKRGSETTPAGNGDLPVRQPYLPGRDHSGRRAQPERLSSGGIRSRACAVSPR